MSGSLTDKQQRFVEEYLVDLNATQAATRAGYSAKTAEQQASRLLGNVKVATAVADAQAERAERVQVSADEVLTELVRLIRSDVRDFHVDDDGHLTLRDDAPDSAWRAVSSVKHKIRSIPQGRGEEPIVERDIEFRLWDKKGAIDTAMKHLGLLKDRVEHTGASGGPIRFTLAIGAERGDSNG